MKDDLKFEHFLQEQTGRLQIRPSDKIWKAVQESISIAYTPRFNYPIIFLFSCIFLNIYTPVNNTGFNVAQYLKRINTYAGISANMQQPTLKNSSAEKQKTRGRLGISNNSLNNEDGYNGSISPQADFTTLTRKTSSYHAHANTFKCDGYSPPPLTEFAELKNIDLTMTLANNKRNSLLNKLKEKIKGNTNNKKLAFYFTPSLSYRILSIDNRPYFNNNGAGAESSVSHFPASGFEAGVAILNPISKRWRFRSGLQINFSRYNINASKSNMELVFVSTAQNAGFERMTNIRNGGGLLPKKLLNENLQVSLPFGLEYTLTENKRYSMNIAGTVQPSFSIYAGGYMITTNYKNYIPADNLYRRYNILTGLEFFAKTNIGGIDLQVGPQVRYQLLSNTIGTYPVKEHLIDYGFKIGIVKKID
jgi:hypothetical protein